MLLSSEYSASIVWDNDELENGPESVETYIDDTDRMFTFEVSKRNEQEENAVVRPGFQVFVSRLSWSFVPNSSKDVFPLHSA